MTYRLVRSDRKTLAIQIDRNCDLIVRAPRHLPQREIDRFLAEKEDWITCHMALQQQRMAAHEQAHPEPDEARWAELRQKALSYVPPRVDYFARRMGVQPTAIRFSTARTRWGSCSPKNSITFSLRLMDYPDAAIDAVIVHELAHIRYKNHGKAFYDFVYSILPDYRERDKLLKK